MNPAVGENLKRIRREKGITLEKMAEACAVSKPMLSQIERGQSIPTISTLWKIASGLHVPLSSLLKEESAGFELADRNSCGKLVEEDGRMKAWLLFPFDPIRALEVFEIEFEPGCRHCSLPHDPGVEEYILVCRGHLTMELNGQSVKLDERKTLRFEASQPHCYENEGEETCRIYNVIVYGSL